MINNAATFSSARNSLSISHPGQLNQSERFYDHVRAEFLHQSARYLRDSYARQRATSLSGNKQLL